MPQWKYTTYNSVHTYIKRNSSNNEDIRKITVKRLSVYEDKDLTEGLFVGIASIANSDDQNVYREGITLDNVENKKISNKTLLFILAGLAIIGLSVILQSEWILYSLPILLVICFWSQNSESLKQGNEPVSFFITNLSNILYPLGYLVLYSNIIALCILLYSFFSLFQSFSWLGLTVFIGSLIVLLFAGTLLRVPFFWIEELILVKLPMKGGWIPLDHLRRQMISNPR